MIFIMMNLLIKPKKFSRNIMKNKNVIRIIKIYFMKVIIVFLKMILMLMVDIPVVITVVSEGTNIARRLEYGASILNVAGAADTPAIVQKIRAQYPDIPIIASGGNSNENIRATIRAGANAVTYTPPSTKELFRATMSKYRES